MLETRSLSEFQESLAANPHSFAFVELSMDRDKVLKFLLDRLLGPNPGPLVVLAPRESEGYRALALELGAVAVVESGRGLAPLCDAVRRWLATIEPPALSFRERIWDKLPWRPVAQGRPAGEPG